MSKKLLEAVRVMPSRRAMVALRSYREAWEATADDRESKLALGALNLLIETHDKIRKALES